MYGGSKGETDYYRYNGFNQLSEFEKDTGLSQNEKYYYYYNADGLRAKKVKEDLGAENGSGTRSAALDKNSDVSGMATQLTAPKKAFTTNYYYNGGKLVLETDGEGTTTAKTLHGIHLIKREVMNVQGIGLTPTQGSSWGTSSNATPGSAVDKNGNMTYFFVQNSRGDVIKLLNENDDIIRDYEYEPFGKEQDVKTNGYGADYYSAKWKQEVEDNAIDNPFRFGGEYKDNESGNYYLRARYYDPETQRFTQEDTYKGDYKDPMSLNAYAFCSNNPIDRIDPSGNKDAPAGWHKAPKKKVTKASSSSSTKKSSSSRSASTKKSSSSGSGKNTNKAKSGSSNANSTGKFNLGGIGTTKIRSIGSKSTASTNGGAISIKANTASTSTKVRNSGGNSPSTPKYRYYSNTTIKELPSESKLTKLAKIVEVDVGMGTGLEVGGKAGVATGKLGGHVDELSLKIQDGNASIGKEISGGAKIGLIGDGNAMEVGADYTVYNSYLHSDNADPLVGIYTDPHSQKESTYGLTVGKTSIIGATSGNSTDFKIPIGVGAYAGIGAHCYVSINVTHLSEFIDSAFEP
ncbi:RHS repeat-associated core domain-containing protein [Aminipila terrae]|uniref:RHS repeat-associated core domain-containing protein n=1 Tax=Aminipila terrae TaxID=2697030 RepID=A0A6P1MLB2_9FIRM|nr:RHS repeat-associated core domain-containing protein [Aminipila terrae]QHI73464.1 hypothetical protein Ami3637_14725 [Aminipila terrae]